MARFVCATIAAYGANDLLLPHGPRLRFSGNAADKNDMAVARRAVNRSEPLVFLFFLLGIGPSFLAIERQFQLPQIAPTPMALSVALVSFCFCLPFNELFDR